MPISGSVSNAGFALYLKPALQFETQLANCLPDNQFHNHFSEAAHCIFFIQTIQQLKAAPEIAYHISGTLFCAPRGGTCFLLANQQLIHLPYALWRGRFYLLRLLIWQSEKNIKMEPAITIILPVAQAQP